METLIVSLILAALSGLAILGVKHYEIYVDVSDSIAKYSSYIFFCSMAYITGHDHGLSNLYQEFGTPSLSDISDSKLGLPFITYSAIAYMALRAYLSLIQYIGNRINHKEPEDPME
ncbi:MAG: hypothetical protein RPT95_10365 [Candidatus Sedimenticola sp. (ex Thyasira tokunagai)]